MQPLASVVALGAAPARAARSLDATALGAQVLLPGEDLFRQLKQAEAGAFVLVFADGADDAALAHARKAAQLLRQRGGGDALVVLPPLPASPGPQARDRLRSAAARLQAAVVQPVEPAGWAHAAACFLEPLAIYGLVGITRDEVRHFAQPGSVSLLHAWSGALPEALQRELRQSAGALISRRLGPAATLRELNDLACALSESLPRGARLVLACPETEQPGCSAAVLL